MNDSKIELMKVFLIHVRNMANNRELSQLIIKNMEDSSELNLELGDMVSIYLKFLLETGKPIMKEHWEIRSKYTDNEFEKIYGEK